ncbi:MAG: uroporphyrinogen-III C-methyltransferase [Candidatus Omnitrophica bacterium]|nr:uroporphyrinogen-III C-methyltransferase [Candidatus Omnitrophota bacterium]
MKKGKVCIVGAGPGDWELISVKGFNRIKEADVILYDFLASKELLNFTKKGAQLICVGKADGIHLLEQDEINLLLFKKAKEGNLVVRLKGGDPFVFSRGIEEALYLKRKGVDFEIVQGITCAFGAPESFGIPLTRRGEVSSVAVLTGRKSNGRPIDAPDCDTLVYLMAVSNIKKVVTAILKSGRPKATPCAFIERGTAKEERSVAGNLGNIISKARSHALRAPSVFIVGNVVEYGKKIYGHKFK